MGNAGSEPTREQVSEDVRRTVATMFGVPMDGIKEETAVEDIERWDSTSQVALMLQVEDQFGIQFDLEDAIAFKTIGELIDECARLTRRSELA